MYYTIAQPVGVFVRVLAVALLVSGTYNPSGYSYYHWAFGTDTGQWAVKAVVGLVIVTGFVICANATVRSLGLLLGVPVVAVIATTLWLLSDWGWIDFSDWLERTLAYEGAVIALLGTGVSFSLIRYRLSGQLDSRTLT